MPAYIPSNPSKTVREPGNPVVVSGGSLTTALEFTDADGNIFNEIDLTQFARFSLEIYCSSGTVADVQLQHSTDGTNWAVVESDFFDGMVNGEVRSLENTDNSRPFLRVLAQGSGGPATIRCTLVGSVA